ncbi:roq [Drosophila busckii]|uniref:RING-type E3 ubiquitin transferase n=1 Tax=Drosophila busckii TaxID=30019 RepID=A0A0M4EFQ2_DROBS|nr:roq [Drosophila busckii]
MPIQAPSWTDFLNCPICCNEFAASQRVPISLGCGHTICKLCLTTLYNRQCPFDQTVIVTDIDSLPINYALLQLVGNGSGAAATAVATELAPSVLKLPAEDLKCYKHGKQCIEELALHLKSFLNQNSSNLLTRPMQRKLVTLINCQLMEKEGRVRALRAARSLGERTVTELILQHQNPQQLSSNLWAAVRTRGCQFLGPAMQEQVLQLVLLALEEGSALSRKVLVMFVVQRLEPTFPQASKTSIGHVVQLLYRASCFKVSKREADSSLMQLKEEFRTYDALRREHDAQIVQIATEAGLRIAPEQWSSLLYGDIQHKSHMQSIIDKLQTPSSFKQSVQELLIALQRTPDTAKLTLLQQPLQYLASIDAAAEETSWSDVSQALDAVRQAVLGLVNFLQHHGVRKPQETSLISGPASSTNTKYKISLCRDLNIRGVCPRGTSCTFAHSQEEVDMHRARNRGKHMKVVMQQAVVKKPLGNELAPHNSAAMLPISPMHYMPPPAPSAPPRAYAPPAHGGVHPQLLHGPHAAMPRSPTQPVMNGLLVAPRFEPRFGFNRNAPPLPPAGRNPPNYNYHAPPPPPPYYANDGAPQSKNNLWEHAYMPKLAPSSKPTNHRVMAPILPATADTSFYEKKPPSNVNLELELVKPLPLTDAASIADTLPLFRNSSNSHHNNNNTNSHNHNNNNNNNNNTNSLLFWNTSNKELANFVRSDSILDDDTATFDVPTGSSLHSRYGPICPKRSSSNLQNWLTEQAKANSSLPIAELSYAKRESNNNGNNNINNNANKNSAGRDSVFIWNSDLNANPASTASNFWSNSESAAAAAAAAATTTAVVQPTSHNERLKQQLERKPHPQLLSEDSFEGGIDSSMMSELEKKLVDIVDPDDSGIKLD